MLTETEIKKFETLRGMSDNLRSMILENNNTNHWNTACDSDPLTPAFNVIGKQMFLILSGGKGTITLSQEWIEANAEKAE